MSVTCKGCGQASTTSDYCSECGDAIDAAASSSTSAAQPVAPDAATASGTTPDKCPVCSGDREDPTGQYCDVCGYDFVNKVGGEVAPDPLPAASTPAAQPAPPVAVQSANLGPRLTIEFSTPGAPVAKFTLFEEENLIGRKSASVPQTVKLATNDTAISRRQLMVTRQTDGTWTVRDLVQGGNTVKVSPDKVLAEGEEYTLSAGDVLEVGDQSQIKIVSINS